uniref:Netrin receptor DCC n=1 Tax=Noccaea caerulescens TaxID=107243 RepID=A0A1J3FE56_NOCCA
MPTFSAIALDRMLEPGASSSAETVPTTKSFYSKPPISKLEKGKDKLPNERTLTRPHMSPALYATPDAILLPNSPSSFPPSPYIINHKSRGPRLLKSSSEANVASQQKTMDDEIVTGETDVKASPRRKSTSFSFPTSEAAIEDDFSNGVHARQVGNFDFDGIVDGPVEQWSPLNEKTGNGKSELDNAANGVERENDLPEPVTAKADKESESEDFYDPGESASFTSDAGEEGSQRLATPVGEFYDAWDELSTDSGMQSSVNNIESEVREIRLSLVMEIEKRKQTEEALEQMRIHWQRLREQLAQVGLFVPIDPTTSTNNMNLSEELRCQLEVARFVSDSLGRGMAKAEVEMEMESMLETKNFEITRLSDRLHYYEAVNREMSQRNQEAIEVARRERQKRKKRQRWIWGSIAATITLGSAALAWSYIPASKPSSSEVSQSLKDD